MRTLFTISALFIFSFCTSQKQAKLTLITAEYRVDSPKIGNFTYLVANRFSDGILFTRDTIAGFPTNKEGVRGSYVRFDLGRNFIYQNRYIISGTGNVIDAKNSNLVMEESDDFVEALGDTLVFYRNNIFTGTGYLHLDLRTGKYKFVNHEERNIHLRFSPDKKQSLYIDQSKLPYKIMLKRDKQKDEIIVADAGSGPNLTGGVQSPTIRTYWLNNTSFLYSVHKIIFPIKEDIYSDVVIRKFNISTKEDVVFAKLDSVKTGLLNDNFYKDDIDSIIYKTSEGKSYVVDTANRKLAPYLFYQLGFDFSEEYHFSKEYGRTIFYKASEIGRLWCSDETVTKGGIAVEYGNVGSNLGYTKGFKVWTTKAGSWTTIDVPWLCAIIGWMEEE